MTNSLNLKNPGPPVNDSQIDAFEMEVGGALPNEYRQFLRTSNGGFAEPELAFWLNGRLNTVPYFYSLLESRERGLRKALREFRDTKIADMVPVSFTLNQEAICLCMGDDKGSVWLADYAYRSEPTLTRLADSFSKFLEALFEKSESAT